MLLKAPKGITIKPWKLFFNLHHERGVRAEWCLMLFLSGKFVAFQSLWCLQLKLNQYSHKSVPPPPQTFSPTILKPTVVYN